MNKLSSFFLLSIHPWGLIVSAGAIACATTLFGFLGQFSWFLDLFSHFRIQYLFGLLVLSVILFIGHRCNMAIMFLFFSCVNLFLVLPLYFGRPKNPAGASPVSRVMLLNVNTSLGDANRVKDVISAVSPDIIVLEEISFQWISDLSWLSNSYPHSLTQPREDNFGIGIFSKFPITESKVCYIGSIDVPSILATVNIEHTNLCILATHPPPPGGRDYSQWRNEQLAQLPDYVRSPFPVLLLGDLNVTPWNYHFRKLLKQSGLKDSTKGFGVQPTWPNYSPLLRIPIDHCLHSSDIFIVDRQIGNDVSSDHYPLIIDFVIETRKIEEGTTN